MALALLLCSCSSNGNRYVIEGTTAQSGPYYLYRGYEIVDSAEVVNGHYRFEGEVDSLVPVRNISSGNIRKMEGTARFAPLILEAGTITVAEDDNSPTGGLTVGGTRANKAIHNFAIKGMEIQQASDFVFSREEREQLMERYNKLVVNTIERNLNNFASLYMLIISEDRFTAEQKAAYFNRMPKHIQQTEAGQSIKNELQTNN